MKEKNKLLQIASILMIVCAILAIIITAINTNKSLGSISGMTAEESAAVEAQLNAGGVTMDQAMMAVSGIAYVGLALVIIFNVVKIIVGILGIRKADQATGFFTVWGIILLIFGVFGLTSGIFILLGICNLLGGIAAPILFIVGGGQNKKAAAK